nr:hypothetical protein [Chloroflexia bacterium]
IQVDLGQDNLAGGDGMRLDGQTLYIVQSGQISSVALDPDYVSGVVRPGYIDASFASPTSVEVFNGCLLIVNSQFDAVGGQPELPFTVSTIPIPGVQAGTTATPIAGRC